MAWKHARWNWQKPDKQRETIVTETLVRLSKRRGFQHGYDVFCCPFTSSTVLLFEFPPDMLAMEGGRGVAVISISLPPG